MRKTRAMGLAFGRRATYGSAVLALTAVVAASMDVPARSAEGHAAAEHTLCVHGVVAGSLNVRSGPGLDRPVVAKFGRLDCGLRLAGRCEANWCDMEGSHARGWVLASYVGIYEIPPPEPTPRVAGSEAARRVPARHPPKPAPRMPATAPHAAAGDGPSLGVSVRYGLLRAVDRAVGGSLPYPGRGSGGCVAGVSRWDTLRMRRGPGITHREVGRIPSRACHVRHAGPCEGTWCRMSWNGRLGWVNTFYLR